jgi:hypothetical protein
VRTPGQLLCDFHWVVPGEAARSARIPALWLSQFLAANGIKSIINLHDSHPEFRWWWTEEKACLKRGVRYLNATLDSRLLPTRAMLRELWDCFDRAQAPLLIKCSKGQDRVSLAMALYLIERRGWTWRAMAEADAQFTRFRFLRFPRPEQRWLRHFPEFARENAKGAPIRDWVRTVYDPRVLAAWLEKRVGRGSFAGTYADK